ncbi:MAG: isoprenyl transferase [Anaerolineales bacterium]|nr:isoprenyl transferase [Anaerolineales bacterium]
MTQTEALTSTENKMIPTHVAIIMDGNGRWANSRGLPRLFGHQAGSKNVRKIITACLERGIKFLTLYTFSSENWSRPSFEVKGLMTLIGDYIDREAPKLHKLGVRFLHLGRKDELPQSLQNKIRKAVDLTCNNLGITVCVALNYGGRNDIVDAVKSILNSGLKPEEVNEEKIAEHLGTNGIPEPDLVIRTSGENRLSNFLVWETAYSELFFTPTLWPDFSAEILDQALQSFAQRKRRFGGLDVSTANTTSSLET